MPTGLTEDKLERACLEWFQQLGYQFLFGPETAP